MLLKIAEKIIRRNGFEQQQQQKKPGLSANQALEQLRPLTNHTISQAFKTFS